MDKDVIKKIIENLGEPCPSFKYENPLLDKEIADLVSKGFIKLLDKQNASNISQRIIVLKNIRKSCKVEPTHHLHIDDNITEILRRAYEELPDSYNIHRVLDSFLIRSLKEMNITSQYSPSLKPDVVQALKNLNGDEQEIQGVLCKDIIYWNINDNNNKSYLNTLESMWNIDCMKNALSLIQSDDISIKIKPSIEKTLLYIIASDVLGTVIIDEDDWFSEKEDLQKLILISSVSSECFQICCAILNSIFIKTYFDLQILHFIKRFISAVKLKVENISQLYECNLKHIVLLLDVQLETFDREICIRYVKYTLKHLQNLHEECENDVIMLLSHFDNKWFQYYFEIQSSRLEDK